MLHIYDSRTGLTTNARRNATWPPVFHDHARLHAPIGHERDVLSGVDSTGWIVRGEAYEDDYLAPLVTILRVESESPLVLAPVTGALPLGGASGGGIFDRRGALIANLTGTGWESDRNGVTYSIDACAVSVMQYALE